MGLAHPAHTHVETLVLRLLLAPLKRRIGFTGKAAVRITQPSESAAAPRQAPGLRGFLPVIDCGPPRPPVRAVSEQIPESQDGPDGPKNFGISIFFHFLAT
jgi:hypothetical protein